MTFSNLDQQQVWMDARTALRMFAESPSASTADKVQNAWDRVQKKAFQSPPAPICPENSNYRQGEKTWENHRLARLREWRGLSWPINEIVLMSLVNAGKSDNEIAELSGVDTASVTALRTRYEQV